MIVYTSNNRRGGKWSAQLRWLLQFWKEGSETMMISGDVYMLNRHRHLTPRAADGGYAYSKFVNEQMNFDFDGVLGGVFTRRR